MRLFRNTDKRSFSVHSPELPSQLVQWRRESEHEADTTVVYYRTPVDVVRDRLGFFGYTLENAKAVFEASTLSKLQRTKKFLARCGELGRERLAVLEALSVENWLRGLAQIAQEDPTHDSSGGCAEQELDALLRYMRSADWYGFPTAEWYPDTCAALRLALEVIPEGQYLLYDVTDLVLSGYVSLEQDLVSDSLNEAARGYVDSAKIIVLTEGRTDSCLLSDSLRLLYPHLYDYYSFLDFDITRVGGGAGNLANLVKAFAAAGVVNRTIALFDNDTAAEAAIRSLRDFQMPHHIVVKTLPDLPFLRGYPTTGPTGPALMDINGTAASLELYLGSDVLCGPDGQLAPVQWQGLDPGTKRYQGALIDKRGVQTRFAQKLQAARDGASCRDEADWDGLRAVFGVLFSAFHERDGEIIRSRVREE